MKTTELFSDFLRYAALNVAGQAGHGLFIEQEAEVLPLPVINRQPYGIGAQVHNAADHASCPLSIP